jgi:DNA-binding protein H-NS
MPTYKQLLAEKEALEAKLNEVRANEVAGVIEQIRQLMADYDLTVEDIAPSAVAVVRPAAPPGTQDVVPAAEVP